jgi:hypothetical protein
MTKTNTHAMTNAQITRALLVAQGWHYKREGDVYRLYDAGGIRCATVPAQVPNVWHSLIELSLVYGLFPDWPNDTGAALALCLEIAKPRGWFVAVYDDPRPLTDNMTCTASFLDETNTDIDIVNELVSYMKTRYTASADAPARALALLALATYEAAGDA